MSLLPHQRRRLAAIVNVHQREGRVTVRMLCTELDRGPSAVWKAVAQLRDLGLAPHADGTSASITTYRNVVTIGGEPYVAIPVGMLAHPAFP